VTKFINFSGFGYEDDEFSGFEDEDDEVNVFEQKLTLNKMYLFD